MSLWEQFYLQNIQRFEPVAIEMWETDIFYSGPLRVKFIALGILIFATGTLRVKFVALRTHIFAYWVTGSEVCRFGNS